MPGVWKKTLIYLGLAEEDEDYEDYAYEDYEPEETRQRTPARRAVEPDAGRTPARREGVVRAVPSEPSPRVHLVMPSSFNDAQEIGDRFREGYCVLINLQSANPDLARRLVDFASGLAYGLQGSMQPVADKVFLITPRGVVVSAEERRRMAEERGFFNQL